MVAGTKKWGIGEKVPIDLPAPAASSFGEVSDFTDQLPLLAIGGFGQGSTTMVPMHMAMVASTIANGGVMMKPHVVDATLDHSGGVLSRTTPVGVEDPDRLGDRADADVTDDRGGQQGHRHGRCNSTAASRPRRRPAPRS